MPTIKQKKANVSKEELMSRLPIPGPGRPKKTEEQRIVEKAVKDYIKEHEQGLAEALPEIRPALISQAVKGNMQAITEVHKVLGAHKRTEGGPMVAVQVNVNEDREKYK